MPLLVSILIWLRRSSDAYQDFLDFLAVDNMFDAQDYEDAADTSGMGALTTTPVKTSARILPIVGLGKGIQAASPCLRVFRLQVSCL